MKIVDDGTTIYRSPKCGWQSAITFGPESPPEPPPRCDYQPGPWAALGFSYGEWLSMAPLLEIEREAKRQAAVAAELVIHEAMASTWDLVPTAIMEGVR